MSVATNEAIGEFPFVEALPKKEKSKIVKIWEHFREVREMARKHGAMVPPAMAAELLGVSRQRVDELIGKGRLEYVEVNGHVMVTEDAVVAFASSERKAGRPLKTATQDEWRKASVKRAIAVIKQNT